MISRSRYFLNQAKSSLRESIGVSLVTTATISVALLLLGLYIALLQNLENLTVGWGRVASVVVYLQDDLDDEIIVKLQDEVGRNPLIESVMLVSSSEAIERFRARGPEAAALVDGVNPSVLPNTLELSLQGGFADLTALDKLAEQLQARPEIEAVDYGKDEFAQLERLIEFLRWIGTIMGVALALATAFIISNTIRLNVYARRDEISILGLVGATPWFIRVPFLIEGAAWGLAGGGLATGLLYGADTVMAAELSALVAESIGAISVTLYDPTTGLGLVAAGFCLGVGGSALAVRRFLEVTP